MKKFTFMALAAIAAISISSCGNKTPKADLKSDIDTLSYAIGMAQSNGLSQYLVERMGVDSTYVDDFIKGLNEGVSAGDDKKKAAYYAGICWTAVVSSFPMRLNKVLTSKISL